MWADGCGEKSSGFEDREEELLTSALREIGDILGADGKMEKGWTREEMIEASGMSKEDFTSTFLDFLESRFGVPFLIMILVC